MKIDRKLLLGIAAVVLALGCLHREDATRHDDGEQLMAASEVTESFIVQHDDMESARKAVLQVGASVTHELSIINAVGARLTLSQIALLRNIRGVRIYENRTVWSAAQEPPPVEPPPAEPPPVEPPPVEPPPVEPPPVEPPPVEPPPEESEEPEEEAPLLITSAQAAMVVPNTVSSFRIRDASLPFGGRMADVESVRDLFESVSLFNSDGTKSWKRDWLESDAWGAGAVSGYLQILDGVLVLMPSHDGTEPTFARGADLKNATTAVLRFDFATSEGVVASDAVVVEMSSDEGAKWTIIDNLTGIMGATTGTRIYNVSGFTSEHTMLRFRVAPATFPETAPHFRVDNLEILFRYSEDEIDMWTVEDQFNRPFFNNNDGNRDFKTPWSEVGEADGPYLGSVGVAMTPSGLALRVASGNKGAERRAEIGDVGNAVLILEYMRWYLNEPTDWVSIQMSGDGGESWVEVDKLKGPATDRTPLTKSYDVTSYASQDTRLRLVASPTLGRFESVYFSLAHLCGTAAVEENYYEEGDGSTPPASYAGELVRADELHQQGVTGLGVTVAVVDTGLYPWKSLVWNTRGQRRLGLRYDAIRDQLHLGRDRHGHGSHVTSVILSSEGPGEGRRNGVAPDAGIVSVKAFDDDGRGSYLNVIRGLDWVVRNRSGLNIRVLNLSFSSEAHSNYWADPLNQAVMAAWKAGIVVVASAGNTGPDAMTIGVPGNVPYIITVGAMTNNNTLGDTSDDALAEFSSAGPTVEAFVKPEVVAPGGYMLGVVERFSRLPSHHPEWLYGNYFYMSGTSQAAAVVSGTAALMLQADPSLTPDDVKCRLMASARPAVAEDGGLAYSLFQQ